MAKKSLFYRLCGVGKMPAELKAAAAGGTALHSSEGIPVTQSGSYQVPVEAVAGEVRLHSGAATITLAADGVTDAIPRMVRLA